MVSGEACKRHNDMDNDDVLRCQVCGFSGDHIEDFDGLGGCEGTVFCTTCNTEINDDGSIHQHGQCCDDLAIDVAVRKVAEYQELMSSVEKQQVIKFPS